MPSSSSTSPLVLLILIIFSSLSIAFALVAQRSCSDEFVKITQRKNITMCKNLRTLGAEFGWNYHNGTNSTLIIDVLFGAKLTSPNSYGWLGWGVNPGKRPEMIGTKAIIGVVQTNGSTKVNTYEITKETRMGCHLVPSPLDGIRVSNMSMEYDNESYLYTVSARMVLNSSAYRETRLNHVWQVGYTLENEEPRSHPTALNNVDSTETIDLTSGEGHSIGNYRSYLRTVHGVLNIVGWGTLLPLGVIIPRYFRVYPFKCNKWWFRLHLICQSVGYLTGVAGWAIGLWLGHASKYYTFNTHRLFAIFIFTFTTIQMFALRLRPKQTDDYRRYWNMYHHFLGYALLVVIFINIFKGIGILKGGEGWKWAYVGILALLGAIAFCLEVLTWGKFCLLKKERPVDAKPVPNSKDKSRDLI